MCRLYNTSKAINLVQVSLTLLTDSILRCFYTSTGNKCVIGLPWKADLSSFLYISKDSEHPLKDNCIPKLFPLRPNSPPQHSFPWKSHGTWQPSSYSWRWARACGLGGSHHPDGTPHLKPGWEKSIHLVECQRSPSYRGGKTDKADAQTYKQADRRPDRHTQRHRHR